MGREAAGITSRRGSALAAVVVAGLLLSACGDDDGSADTTAPSVTATTALPGVTMSPTPAGGATTAAGGAASVAVGEVLGLTKDQVCALVDPVVLEEVMGTPPASTTGAFPGDVGPSCIFTGNGDVGVQFNVKGPAALVAASESLGNQVDDIEVAGRRATIEQFSPVSQRLIVWLGGDADPALLVYVATADGAIRVAESVLGRVTG